MNPKWDRRFLELARFVAAWSKDPSTQVGCVIAQGNVDVATGYNGFANDVYDDPKLYADRETKYKLIIHAEVNAREKARGSVRGMTLYTWPMLPCPRCAGPIIRWGIKRVVSTPTPPHLKERWEKDSDLTLAMFRQALVTMDFLDLP